jgi:hypothetical protein
VTRLPTAELTPRRARSSPPVCFPRNVIRLLASHGCALREQRRSDPLTCVTRLRLTL